MGTTLPVSGYSHLLMDIGTGDGRFVQQMAATRPDVFVLGIDACRENLSAASRKAPSNALYVIANAYALPCALHGLATHITIHFPWGSLLAGLLVGHPALTSGLVAVARPGAQIDVWLNSSALAVAGWALEEGTHCMQQGLCSAGFHMKAPGAMSADDLYRLPTTWAKRLAFGRDPAAMTLSGIRRDPLNRSLPCPTPVALKTSQLLMANSGNSRNQRKKRLTTDSEN